MTRGRPPAPAAAPRSGRRSASLLLLLLVGCAGSDPVAEGPQVRVEQPWTPAAPRAAPAADPHASHHGGARAAVYLTLRNTGSEADRLIGVETAAAERAEIHRSLVDDGIARMRQVEAVEVAPGEVVEMRPGGYHIMLIGVKATPVPGERIQLRLRLERGGARDVEVEVRDP
jgi:periplasmic copper chaperone A